MSSVDPLKFKKDVECGELEREIVLDSNVRNSVNVGWLANKAKVTSTCVSFESGNGSKFSFKKSSFHGQKLHIEISKVESEVIIMRLVKKLKTLALFQYIGIR